MWWFILGFVIGAIVGAEALARYMVRKLKEKGLIQPDDEVRPFDPAEDWEEGDDLRWKAKHRTAFDQSQEWDFPL